MTAAGFVSRESSTQKRVILGIALVLLVATMVAGTFGRTRGPNVQIAFVVAATVWTVCDLLTGFLLLVQASITGRLSYFFPAAAYVVSALLTIPYIGASVGLFGTEAKTLGDQQISVAEYYAWHTIFPVLLIAGLRFRSVQLPESRARMVILTAGIAFTVLAAVVFTELLFTYRAQLPRLVVDGHLQAASLHVGMPLVIITNAVACIVLVSTRLQIGSLRLWFALVTLAFCLDGFINILTPARFSYAWDFSKVMMTFASLLVVGRLLVDIVRMYGVVLSLVASQNDQAAARIRAIWKISTTEDLREDRHLQLVLDATVPHIRPQHDVFALLSHIEDEIVVVDAVSQSGDPVVLAASTRLFQPGARFHSAANLHALLNRAGSVVAWQSADGMPAGSRGGEAGWHAAIARSVPDATIDRFVTFGVIGDVSEIPFNESDDAFIDVVAAHIGHLFFRRAQFERMRFQIEHDALTGLLNRTQFSLFLRQALDEASLLAVAVLDIDDFRGINERAGHLIADELLVEVAARLRHVNTGDIVARLGADVFAIVLHREPDGAPLAARLDAYRDVFARPFHTGDRDGTKFLPLSACCGATETVDGNTLDELLGRAYVALDESKARGHGLVTVFGTSSEREMRRRGFVLNELQAAVRNDEFFLEYQPTFELSTRIVSGAEALIRWQHPTRGRLGPVEFIEAARRANMLGEITRWVLGRIFDDLAERDLPPNFRCALNVPSIVLEDESFMRDVEERLRLQPRMAAHLCIEITESDIMNHVEQAIETLNSARAHGMLVAIDDFGTGYSSLSYLKRLPIDIVKLDRAFINGLPDDEKDVGLAEMFLSLTRQFSLVSVAEGIENEAQAAWLLGHGCMIGQGFLYSKPLAVREFFRFLGEHRSLQIH